MITLRFRKFAGGPLVAASVLAVGVSFFLLVSSASELIAATPDAWEDFRNDVKTKMESAVKGKLAKYGLFIEPHGSESYGLAIASGVSADDKQPLTIIGIYDKASRSCRSLRSQE